MNDWRETAVAAILPCRAVAARDHGGAERAARERRARARGCATCGSRPLRVTTSRGAPGVALERRRFACCARHVPGTRLARATSPRHLHLDVEIPEPTVRPMKTGSGPS